MARLKERPRARRDLKAIWRYIAGDSPSAADAFLTRIRETLERLAENPGIGRAREELATGLRSFPVGNYLIFYRPLAERDGIEVVRVIHAARDIENIFEE